MVEMTIGRNALPMLYDSAAKGIAPGHAVDASIAFAEQFLDGAAVFRVADGHGKPHTVAVFGGFVPAPQTNRQLR